MHGSKRGWAPARCGLVIFAFLVALIAGLTAASTDAAESKDPEPGAQFSSSFREADHREPEVKIHEQHDMAALQSRSSSSVQRPEAAEKGATSSRRRRRSYTAGVMLGQLGEPQLSALKPIQDPVVEPSSNNVDASILQERFHKATKRLHESFALVQSQSSTLLATARAFNPAFLIFGLLMLIVAIIAAMAFCSVPKSGPRQDPASSGPKKMPAACYPAPTAEEVAAAAVMNAAEASSRSLAQQRGHLGRQPTFSQIWEGSVPGTAASARPTPLPSARGQLYSSHSVPGATAMSLPPPRRPSFAGGEEGGLFRWSPRSSEEGETLCPCLVVPDGMEFVFAVREVLTTSKQQVSFSVVDLEGSPLSHVIVNETGSGPQCGVYLQMLDREPLALVRTDMMYKRPSRLPEICLPSGEMYCSVVKDPAAGAYYLRSRSGQKLLTLMGNFREKAVKVATGSGQLVCTTERCIIDFEGGTHYQVRVAPETDAGLVLCSLLAIDKIEGGGRAR